jgi:hypothetical protein
MKEEGEGKDVKYKCRDKNRAIKQYWIKFP